MRLGYRARCAATLSLGLLLAGCFGSHTLRDCEPDAPCDCRAARMLPAGDAWVGVGLEWIEGHRETRDAPAHIETLSQPVWLARYEATAECYRRCVDEGACAPPGSHISFDVPGALPGGETYDEAYFEREPNSELPMAPLRFEDAEAYCQWLGGRLPTNGEWERAARGLEGRVLPWRDAPEGDPRTAEPMTIERCGYRHEALGPELAMNIEIPCNEYLLALRPVGSHPEGVGPYGHEELVGEPSEWVADWMGRYPDGPVVDYTGPDTGENRVARGVGTAQHRSQYTPETQQSLEWTSWPHVLLVTTRCAFDEEPEPLLAR